MQFKTTSGSGAAGLGIIGTGLAMALPEAKFIGWALVVAGLFVFAFDIRIERGHIAIGSSKSLRKRMLAIWPQLLMGVSVVGFAVGLAAYLAAPPTHGPHNTQSLTPAFRYVWEALTPQEMSSIRSDLRQIQHPADRPLWIGCSNDNCRDLAESFASVFNDLNWPNVTIEDRSAPDFKGATIEYFVRENSGNDYTTTDPKIAVAIADAIERATQGRVKTRVRPSSLIPTRIIIGPKP